MKLRLAAESDTLELGERLGRALEPGDLVLLFGELGSGKTTLVRGLAKGAGLRARVSSPSFALANVYRGRRLTLHHLDLYRVEPGDAGEIGVDELLQDPRGALAVEWPKSGGPWPADRLEISLAHAPPGRRAELRARGPRARKLLKAMA